MAVVALSASAQKYRLTPHAGLGYTHFTSYNDNTDMNNGLGFIIGGDYEYLFSDNFGVSGGVDYLYSQSSEEKYEIMGQSVLGWQYYGVSYLNVPILAQYHIGRFAIKAGLQPTFNLAAKLYTENKGSFDLKDDFKTFSLSIPVGVSIDFNIPLTLDLRCAIPVTNQNKEGESCKLTTVMLTLGYYFSK